jgi:hypothetical protein
LQSCIVEEIKTYIKSRFFALRSPGNLKAEFFHDHTVRPTGLEVLKRLEDVVLLGLQIENRFWNILFS